jgi:hypothetical protein
LCGWLAVALAGLTLIPLGALAQQGPVWVTSAGTKLVAQPQATAAAVAALPVGAELSVLAAKDKWLQVSTAQGQKGWVYRGKVSSTKPATAGVGLFGPAGKSSLQVSAADTSRSIRGLSPEAEAYAQGAETPVEYKQAVDRTLALAVGPDEVEKFLRDGKIGEYAP